MSNLKCAVIGTGYLGKFHAEKYAGLDTCELVAVVDIDEHAATQVAEKNGTTVLTDYQLLLGQVDAVSIVVPTTLHHKVAMAFLSHGSHVLLEKPMTVTLTQADALISCAKANNVILQVGHLERFNPAVMALDQPEDQPLFIESHRLAPFNLRANDVSVVLDLMIHDIDIILALVDSDIDRIDASGTSVLTQDIDIANARLVFKSGCVANVTASRVSQKIERKMRIFRPSCYVSVDFQSRVFSQHHIGNKEMFPSIPKIETQESTFASGDALLEEIKHFCNCIQTGKQPLVSGESGKRALATAIQINQLLSKNNT